MVIYIAFLQKKYCIMILQSICFFFVFLQLRTSESFRCSGLTPRFNKTTKQCEECPIGYFFFNCSKICQFPLYGKDCQKSCEEKCEVQDCHFKFGCPESKQKTEVVKPRERNSNVTLLPRIWIKTAEISIVSKNVGSSDQEVQIFINTQKTIRNTQLLEDQTMVVGLQQNMFSRYQALIFIGLAGLFVFLFAICVASNIYKNFYQKKSDESAIEQPTKADAAYTRLNQIPQPNTSASIDQRYIIPQDSQDLTYLSPVQSVISEDATYLSPVSCTGEHYEDIDLCDENVIHEECMLESTSIVHDSCLTPPHIYVEVIDL